MHDPHPSRASPRLAEQPSCLCPCILCRTFLQELWTSLFSISPTLPLIHSPSVYQELLSKRLYLHRVALLARNGPLNFRVSSANVPDGFLVEDDMQSPRRVFWFGELVSTSHDIIAYLHVCRLASHLTRLGEDLLTTESYMRGSLSLTSDYTIVEATMGWLYPRFLRLKEPSGEP
jgi:hypothetical protein